MVECRCVNNCRKEQGHELKLSGALCFDDGSGACAVKIESESVMKCLFKQEQWIGFKEAVFARGSVKLREIIIELSTKKEKQN